MSSSKVFGVLVTLFCLLMFYGAAVMLTAAARGQVQYHQAMERAMEAK